MHVRLLYMALRRSAGSLVSLHPLVILVFTSLPPIYHAPHLEAAKSPAADLHSRVQGGSGLLEDFF